MMDAGLPTKIPIAVVDYDNTSTSRSLVRQLDAFPKTDIKFKSLSFKEARVRMERDEIYAILTIPKNFTEDAMSGDRPKLVYYTNNAFLVSGSLLFQDLKTISTLASASVGLQTGEAKGFTEGQLMPVLQPISVESHPLNNPWLNYSVYLAPTMIPCILQMIILLFTVSCFGAEVKSGTGRELLQLSGNSIMKTIVGKLLPYTIIYMLIAILFMSVFYYYCKFPMNSGFWPMFFNYLCLILAAQGVGIIFIASFMNYRFAVSISSLIGSLSLSLVGVSFSVYSMDPILTALSSLLPIRHFFMIYIDQSLNGIPIGYSMYQYAALLTFALISLFFVGRLKRFLREDIYES
jgi:ABC-2 type transport system permease protein